MTIKRDIRRGSNDSATGIVAAASVLGALAASSCCILPLILFGLGVSSAWIGNLTRVAPYQPYFIATTIVLLACGYWLIYRAGRACAEGQACARRLPARLVKAVLVLATTLVAAAVTFDVLAPYFLNL